MKLENRYKGNDYSCFNMFVCELTTELDSLANLTYNLRKHYIVVDEYSLEKYNLPIRIPGGTVGGIEIDNNMIIKNIVIDTDYVIRTYPNNVNEYVKKYIGEKIEIE